MKNIAKILCFVLSLVLVISVMGVTTFADEATVAEVDGVYYTDLIEAFKAAKADSVINILEDVTISDNWDNRKTGAKFTVPVTINGNGHTLKFTGTVNDSNYFSVFRFEKAATVTNLIFDLSEATNSNNRVRAISAKLDLTVDGCSFIGNPAVTNARGIIFGEGAGAAIGNVKVSITNCQFENFRRAIVDNENAQDVKSVVISGNECTNASVYVSASSNVTFNDNVMDGGYVNIKTYSSNNNLTVEAKDNTLETEVADGNIIKAAYVVDADEEFVVTPMGNLKNAFTGYNSIWGECGGNAKESFVIMVYSGEELLGTATLNNVDGIIDGSVYVTWNINLSGESDEYWTIDWSITVKDWIQPTRVEQWIDGEKVAEAPIQLNGPDGINKIVAATVDADGQIINYYTKLADAMANTVDGRVLLLADVNEKIGSFTNVYLYTTNESGVTITSTYTENYVDFDNATVGYNVTLNVNDLYSGGSLNSIDGTLNVAGKYNLGYDATTNVFGTLNVAGEMFVGNNTDLYTGLNIYGDSTFGTLTFNSGSLNVYANVTCGKFVVDSADILVALEGSVVADAVDICDEASLTVYGLLNGEGKYDLIIPVAEVNGVRYPTLQAAIDACVAGNNVVTLLADCDDTVTIKQQANINVVIDGAGYGFSGTFKLNGNKRYYGAETLTIKNVNFYTYDEAHDFITYAVKASNVHNLLVEDCTFTGPEYQTAVRCVVIRSANKVTVRNCTATNVFNLVQNVSGSKNITVEGCTVDAMYGVNLGNAGGTNIVNNNTINASTGYAVNMMSGNNGTASLEGNTVENGFVRVENTSANELTVTITSDNVIPGVQIVGEKVNVDLDDGFELVGKEDGKLGIAEENAIPYIGANGNWWYGTLDSGYKAVPSITVSEDGYWVINGLPTEYKATAENGVSSKVEIGADGFWYINGLKTDVKAQAVDGVGIVKIEKNEALSDTYSTSYDIYLSSNEIITFSVQNGAPGSQGKPGDMGEVGNPGEIGDQGAPGLDGYDGSDVVVIAIVAGGICALLALVVLGFRVFKRNPFAI